MSQFFGFQNNQRSQRLLESETGVVKYAGLSGNKLLYAMVFTATVGFSLFGYDQGLMSGIIASPQFNMEFPATKKQSKGDVHAGTIQGTVTSCYEVGCFFGAMFAFFVGEKFGRRKMMTMGGYIMIIGTIITVSSFGPGVPNGNVGGFVQFFIGRVITGLGNGANTATIPSWIAESSKAKNRGFLICIEASTVAVGTVIAYWIDFGLSYVDQGGVSWRFPMAFQIFFAIILLTGTAILPESPRWLMKHGYEAESHRVCAALGDVAATDPIAIHEKEILMDAIAASQSQKAARAADLLKGGKNQHLRRALVGASTQLFQQIGGCNAVIYYSTVLFEESIGLTGRLPLILGGVLSVVYMLFALTSFFLVESVGRRKLFFIGTFGQGISMFITFGCLSAGKHSGSAAREAQDGKGAAFGLFLFIAFFGATWLPLPWLYPAELNSMAVRTQANAVSTMTNWISNFLVVQVLPTMTASIDEYTFLLFALANIIFLPFIYFFYPETTGRTLEEIDVVYAHAHITKRRATLIADELPKLTEHQIQTMTERYGIHHTDGDVEGLGAAINGEQPDTTLPPPHADEFRPNKKDLNENENGASTPSSRESEDEQTAHSHSKLEKSAYN